MYAKNAYVSLFAGALLVVALCAGTAQAAPKITSPVPIYDFGERPNTEKVPYDFVIKNEGDTPLEIADVKSSCGCTVAKLTKKTLQPGEETTVTATLQLRGEGVRTQNITVMSNDPETPNFILGFKGVAVASIKHEPSSLNFGQIVDEATHEAKLKIFSALDEISFKITDLSTNHAFLEASYEALEDGKSYEVTVKNTEPFPSGQTSGVLTLQTDHPEAKEFRIFISAQAVGDFLLQPEKILLRYEETPDKVVNSFLRVSPGRVSAFEIVDVIKPLDSIGVQLERQGDMYMVRLQNLPVDDSLDGKELVLTTNVVGHEKITVPITVMKPQLPPRTQPAPAPVPAPVN